MKKVILSILSINLIILIIVPYSTLKTFNLFFNSSQRIDIYNVKTGEIMELDIEEYLKGVVAAEMPALFEIEALKAQSVAARTYTLNKMRNSRLTTDSNTDQAWASQEDLLQRWGLSGYLNYWPKISAAVEETKGWVLFYRGDFINAVYHSTSGDYTEPAHKVWGNRVSYLQSVASDYEQESPYYQRNSRFSRDEVANKLEVSLNDLSLIEISKRSSSDRVLEMRVGDDIFSGREIRSKLALHSTNFSLKEDGEYIVFSTSGYGHGVGMSQYGANGMARRGYDFKDILQHYYTGVTLKEYNN
ncbi:stage II sporulation protein D [Halonatronum saccharophilum]|uniref:stage II sporulation protein D n=1 Tax=Halonatronum saccharophilum TaxID=150060 RepID=UPI0004802CE9|nr:stage II sporulation protein D [Halonatronum saccharophilum]